MIAIIHSLSDRNDIPVCLERFLHINTVHIMLCYYIYYMVKRITTLYLVLYLYTVQYSTVQNTYIIHTNTHLCLF